MKFFTNCLLSSVILLNTTTLLAEVENSQEEAQRVLPNNTFANYQLPTVNNDDLGTDENCHLMMNPPIEEEAKAVGEALGVCGRGEGMEGMSSVRAENSNVVREVSFSPSANQVVRSREGSPKKFQPTGGPKSTGDTSDEEEDEDDADIIDDPVGTQGAQSASTYLKKEICDNIYEECVARVAAMLLNKSHIAGGGFEEEVQEAKAWDAAEKEATFNVEKAERNLEIARRETEEAGKNNLTTSAAYEVKKMAEKFDEAKVEMAYATRHAIEVRNSAQSEAAEIKIAKAKAAEISASIALKKTLKALRAEKITDGKGAYAAVIGATFSAVDALWQEGDQKITESYDKTASDAEKNAAKSAAQAAYNKAKIEESAAREAYKNVVMLEAQEAVSVGKPSFQEEWGARVAALEQEARDLRVQAETTKKQKDKRGAERAEAIAAANRNARNAAEWGKNSEQMTPPTTPNQSEKKTVPESLEVAAKAQRASSDAVLTLAETAPSRGSQSPQSSISSTSPSTKKNSAKNKSSEHQEGLKAFDPTIAQEIQCEEKGDNIANFTMIVAKRDQACVQAAYATRTALADERAAESVKTETAWISAKNSAQVAEVAWNKVLKLRAYLAKIAPAEEKVKFTSEIEQTQAKKNKWAEKKALANFKIASFKKDQACAKTERGEIVAIAQRTACNVAWPSAKTTPSRNSQSLQSSTISLSPVAAKNSVKKERREYQQEAATAQETKKWSNKVYSEDFQAKSKEDALARQQTWEAKKQAAEAWNAFTATRRDISNAIRNLERDVRTVVKSSESMNRAKGAFDRAQKAYASAFNNRYTEPKRTEEAYKRANEAYDPAKEACKNAEESYESVMNATETTVRLICSLINTSANIARTTVGAEARTGCHTDIDLSIFNNEVRKWNEFSSYFSKYSPEYYSPKNWSGIMIEARNATQDTDAAFNARRR